ncbi:MAG TPA: CPBP family intramembrane glutamic endopeptidase [Chryseolinea sp.]
MFDPRLLVSNRLPFLSLCLILATVFIGFAVVGPLLGVAVASSFYDGNLLSDMLSESDRPGYFLAVMVVQGIATFVGLIVFPILHITQLEHKPLQPFFPAQPKMGQVLLGVTLLGLAFIVAMSPVVEWNSQLHFPSFLKEFETWAREKEEMATKLTETLTQFKSMEQMLIALLVIAILPGIGEELVFRGLIQRELWRSTQNVHLAIWTSAFLFSAIHLQFFGFFPRLFLGALFGYLYYWSNNLLVPMFAHFFNNGFAVVTVYLNQQNVTEIDMENNIAAPWPYVATAFVATVGLLYFVWKHYRENPPVIEDFHSPSALQDENL